MILGFIIAFAGVRARHYRHNDAAYPFDGATRGYFVLVCAVSLLVNYRLDKRLAGINPSENAQLGGRESEIIPQFKMELSGNYSQAL